MHGLYSYLESIGGEPSLHELSHAEGFLALFGSRVTQAGVYLLDEPDAALSFTATLSLVLRLSDLVALGAQVVVATHSPVLAALPACTCSRWARGDCGRPGGPTWSSPRAGGSSSTTRCRS
jgi:predicted ATPase